MFKHFIITRFNVKLDRVTTFDRNNKSIQTEEWLEHRFMLFEKYCLPSIMNQSCKNFIWFVLFDPNTTERFLQKIHHYESQFPLFKPLFLERGDFSCIKKSFIQEKNKYLDSSTQYIITTRIDNDDAFHKEAICEIQKCFTKQNDVFISFTYGLQYDIDKKVLAQLNFDDNHFISRVEKNSNQINTVITLDHTEIKKVAGVIYNKNKGKPMWIEIIHSTNLINKLYPTAVPILFYNTRELFSFDLNLSVLQTTLVFFNYVRLKILILRATLLKRIGIYEMLKKKIKG